MATGEYLVTRYDGDRLPFGWAVTSSGRLSVAAGPGELPGHYPFPNLDLMALDNALTNASRHFKARFAVYVETSAPTPRPGPVVLADVPTPNNAVLLAVSPDQRAIGWLTARNCVAVVWVSGPAGVSAAASAFREGNLIDRLISALQVMSAGISRP